jgi:hypothetical protein
MSTSTMYARPTEADAKRALSAAPRRATEPEKNLRLGRATRLEPARSSRGSGQASWSLTAETFPCCPRSISKLSF